MFRNSYDNDSVTYSPTGRLFQVEYALEAIKQGSAAVGLVSKTHVVLVALKRNAEELGSYQRKIIRIDDHMGIALSGLAPDARVLANHLRTMAIREQLLYNRPLPVSRATDSIAAKAQTNTQQYGRRPYGVGLFVAGYDAAGPHLVEFLPSGSVLEYVASAIGARSQAARTYLERVYEDLADCSLEQLVIHGLEALRETLAQDKQLTMRNTTVAVVGKDTKFTMLDDDDVAPWLEKLPGLGRTTHSDVAGDANGNDAPAGPTTEPAQEQSQNEQSQEEHAESGGDRMDES